MSCHFIIDEGSCCQIFSCFLNITCYQLSLHFFILYGQRVFWGIRLVPYAHGYLALGSEACFTLLSSHQFSSGVSKPSSAFKCKTGSASRRSQATGVDNFRIVTVIKYEPLCRLRREHHSPVTQIRRWHSILLCSHPKWLPGDTAACTPSQDVGAGLGKRNGHCQMAPFPQVSRAPIGELTGFIFILSINGG